MKTLKLISLIGGLVFATVSVPGSANSGLDPVAAADWRVDAQPSVIERNFDKKAVAMFFDNFRGVDPSDDLADPPAKPEQVGDFTWVDIDKDGTYELFATFAESRAFYNGPTIFKSQAGKKSVLQGIPGWPAKGSVRQSMQDLNQDGTPELLVATYFSHYRGALTSDIWRKVYQWNGRTFEDQSANFKDYYLKQFLSEIDGKIRELSSQPFNADNELLLAMQYALRDKIMRFTGQDTRAGIDRAREWAKSSNQELRTLAVDVFKDAGLQTYSADIKLLATDTNPYVANYAKAALK